MVATSTLLVTALALTAASAGIGAYGAYSSGQAQKDAANYNAAVQKNQAATAAQQAEFDAGQIRDRNRRLVATQRANFAANGVDPDSGSAVDVQHDSAKHGELQALMAIYTGQTSSNASLAQAKLDKSRGQYAEQAGWINAGSSVLGGVNQAVSIYANPNFRNK